MAKFEIFKDGRFVGMRKKLPKSSSKLMKVLKNNFGKGRFIIVGTKAGKKVRRNINVKKRR